jgi:hypothetical protein
MRETRAEWRGHRQRKEIGATSHDSQIHHSVRITR